MAKNLSDIDTRRKNRVQRLKRGIIIGLIFAILIPIILSIILLLKVNDLQKQIDVLYESRNSSVIYSAQKHKEENNQANVAYAKEIEDEELLVKEMTDVSLIYTEDEKFIDTSSPEAKDITSKVYLTFDDGPSQNTDEILDILNQYGVKATFFVVGKEDEYSKEMYRRIVEEGHTLGMHSYSHKYSILYDSIDAFVSDITRLQDYLYEITGVKTNLFRFPGGSSNLVSNIEMNEFISYLNVQGITYYDWNVSSGDATNREISIEQLVNNVITDVSKYQNSVVLMHDADNKTNTVKALPEIIEKLLEMEADIEIINDSTTPIQHIKAELVN